MIGKGNGKEEYDMQVFYSGNVYETLYKVIISDADMGMKSGWNMKVCYMVCHVSRK